MEQTYKEPNVWTEIGNVEKDNENSQRIRILSLMETLGGLDQLTLIEAHGISTLGELGIRQSEIIVKELRERIKNLQTAGVPIYLSYTQMAPHDLQNYVRDINLVTGKMINRNRGPLFSGILDE